MRHQMTPELVEFAARDGFKLNLIHYAGGDASAGPVIVLHGAGVRSNIFLPPTEETFVDALLDANYDVWLLNWRASIDLPPNKWTLEDAAVLDHPIAVRTVLERTGAKSAKAVIHCQGSTSFMMSVVAGLVPEITAVVSNAVSLHPIVPALAHFKSRFITVPASHLLDYLNPQWGLSVPRGWPAVIDWVVRATHHECNNAVCKHSSFTFGAGFPTLWLHQNLDDATHEWLKGEFAHVPMTFFREMHDCIEAGHLVSSGKYSELPTNFVGQAPKTEARFVFLGGEFNHCFVPESQQRTAEFFDRHAPGRAVFHEMTGYGHLDVFIGKNAARDNFPLIVNELNKG